MRGPKTTRTPSPTAYHPVVIPAPPVNADTLDGKHAADFAAALHSHDNLYIKKYASVVIVAKSGGDFADPLIAVDSITDAGADKPYLIKIMPGVYSNGAAVLQMREYVDIEGSGRNSTKIIGTGSAVISGAPNSELRMLSVENSGSADDSSGVRVSGGMDLRDISVTSAGTGYVRGLWIATNPNSGPAVLSDVKVLINVGGTNNYGIFNQGDATVHDAEIIVLGGEYAVGFWNYGGSMRLSNSNVRVADGSILTLGVYNFAAPLSTVSNVAVSASGAGIARAIQNDNSVMDIDKSEIEGPVAVFSQGTTRLGYSKITSGQVSGTVKCIYLTDGNYDPYVCP